MICNTACCFDHSCTSTLRSKTVDNPIPASDNAKCVTVCSTCVALLSQQICSCCPPVGEHHVEVVGKRTTIHGSCAVQEQGWCHGDVTRDNIVMATSADGSTAFTLIDFGFTTKLGENIVCRTTNLRTGASSQLEDNLARSENDVESLMYVLMELVGFPLPWAAAASFGDKAAVSLPLLAMYKTRPIIQYVPITIPSLGAGPCYQLLTGDQCFSYF